MPVPNRSGILWQPTSWDPVMKVAIMLLKQPLCVSPFSSSAGKNIRKEIGLLPLPAVSVMDYGHIFG